jgi:probable phosphoglycerate mutase
MAADPTHARFQLVLVRHGETEWSALGKHTGVSDIPLTEAGRATARRIGARLEGHTFTAVWTSSRVRAIETCAIAGLGSRAMVVPTIDEWSYGDYEGRTTDEIRVHRPGWSVWNGGCPGGESINDVALRADRAIDVLRAAPGDKLLFSHGHFLRVLAARWLGLAPVAGRYFALAAGGISVLAWERETPVIDSWNERVE